MNVNPPRNQLLKHLPVALVIDKSLSTEDIRDEINQCVKDLLRQMKQELVLRGIVELLVVFFSTDIYMGKDKSRPRLPQFIPLEEVNPERVVLPESEGCTHTGKALLYTIQLLEEKKQEWKNKGDDYFQPLMYLLTDGAVDPGVGATEKVCKEVDSMYQEAAEAIKHLEKLEKLTFVAAGIQQENGEYCADMEQLEKLSNYPDRIIKVSEKEGANGMDRFFKVILEMTRKTCHRDFTPVSQVIGDIFDV